jgi:uncharacterized membrane protein
MIVDNPLRTNDWEIKKFLILIISAQLIFCGLIGLDILGVHITLLRQVFCVTFLLFVPGILILRILKIHKISEIEFILYSISLSVTFIMLLGYILNLSSYILPIYKPLTTEVLVVAVNIIYFILLIITYFIDRKCYYNCKIEVKIKPT